jgi:Holliday junction resolvase RusA-like endonuclease
MIITLKGRIPSKKNSRNIFCRGGKPVNTPNDKYKTWHEDCSWQLKKFKERPSRESGLTVYITITAPDRLRGDLSNKAESIMDLLVDNGFIIDDNWFVVETLTLMFGGVDKENPGAVIEII